MTKCQSKCCLLIENYIDSHRDTLKKLSEAGGKHGGYACCEIEKTGLNLEKLLSQRYCGDSVVDGLINTEEFDLCLIEFKSGNSHQKVDVKSNTIKCYGCKPGGLSFENFQNSDIFKKYTHTINNCMNLDMDACSKCEKRDFINNKNIPYIWVEENIDSSFIALMFRIADYFKRYNIKFMYVPYDKLNQEKLFKNKEIKIISI